MTTLPAGWKLAEKLRDSLLWTASSLAALGKEQDVIVLEGRRRTVGEVLDEANEALEVDTPPASAQPESQREGYPHDDPQFVALCREHDILGTAMQGLVAVFWRASAQDDAKDSVIAGALFDFMGFLTTLDQPVTLGASKEATIAVKLLEQWAEKRGLHLSEADVKGWDRRRAPAAGDARDDLTRWTLRWIMREADAAKETCGTDPESPAAIRNAKLAAIATAAAQALGLVRGPSYADPGSGDAQDAARWRWIFSHAENVGFDYQSGRFTTLTIAGRQRESLVAFVDAALAAQVPHKGDAA
ncbi:hypothetical protein [Bordetella genomosp. 12]|uniref:Uncharacterized protein n=1 Tax=Bordetella genomosp. 12 TaxID=463035 RepID=A0A261VK87_9BORD|nr:hypothetical protein [Bordetella genomosp. 12]OZI74548.1 hypothetical protein CAL22_08800 [Bordetella genomosp. 12]